MIYGTFALRCVLQHINRTLVLNQSLPGQNGRYFADDIFNSIFRNENLCILTRISLKFVPRDPIDNKSALVQVTAYGGPVYRRIYAALGGGGEFILQIWGH